MRTLVLVGAVALVCSGCGGDDSDSGGAPSGVTVSGKAVLAGLSIAVVGAEICAPDLAKPVCATSAADGTFALAGIPKNQVVVFTGTKAGFVSALGYFDVGDTDFTVDVGFQEDKIVQGAFDPAGVTVDLTKASLGILIEDGAAANRADFTASIAPASGEGPFYSDSTGLKVDPAAVATSSAGAALFVNMSAGKYTLTLTGSGTCAKDNYSVMTGDKTWETEVRNGFTTYHIVTCAP